MGRRSGGNDLFSQSWVVNGFACEKYTFSSCSIVCYGPETVLIGVYLLTDGGILKIFLHKTIVEIQIPCHARWGLRQGATSIASISMLMSLPIP